MTGDMEYPLTGYQNVPLEAIVKPHRVEDVVLNFGNIKRVIPEPIAINPLQSIIKDILVEIRRQDEKWGDQYHPSFDREILDKLKDGFLYDRKDIARAMTDEYEIPSESRAKYLCDKNTTDGTLTWAHIVVEELSEAISTLDDREATIQELIQLASVIIQWIKCIKNEKEN